MDRCNDRTARHLKPTPLPAALTGRFEGNSVSRALIRRIVFVVGIGIILGVAIVGTILQRRSLADYSSARTALRGDIGRYEKLLRAGEPRARAVSALRAAGAQVDSLHGDIVITVLRELQSSAQCRSLVGVLHVGIDVREQVTGWESPPLNAECD